MLLSKFEIERFAYDKCTTKEPEYVAWSVKVFGALMIEKKYTPESELAASSRLALLSINDEERITDTTTLYTYND